MGGTIPVNPRWEAGVGWGVVWVFVSALGVVLSLWLDAREALAVSAVGAMFQVPWALARARARSVSVRAARAGS
jgi:hypothetical protein